MEAFRGHWWFGTKAFNFHLRFLSFWLWFMKLDASEWTWRIFVIFQGTDEVRAEDTEVLELRCKLNALWFFGNSTKSWKTAIVLLEVILAIFFCRLCRCVVLCSPLWAGCCRGEGHGNRRREWSSRWGDWDCDCEATKWSKWLNRCVKWKETLLGKLVLNC